MNEIVARIDELRQKKGMSKKALMTKMGVKPSTLNNWFYYDVMPSLENIENVCKALDITVEHFFGGMSNENSDKSEEFLDEWRMLTDTEKEAVEKTMAAFRETRSKTK